MCGVAGFVEPAGQRDAEHMAAVVRRMAETLHHRGPDDAGVWCDAGSGVAMGHARLAIIDLSPAGRQPMHSACGRFTIVYNGEIYNHAPLRRELESDGRTFRGHSDTEVLLAAIAEWGMEQAVRRSIGMFAFAVWDAQDRVLTLVRDRLGIKPLYYGWAGKALLFCSELKALRAHPAFRPQVDRSALALFLKHGYIPAPYSIYQGVHKLPPGTMLRVSLTETAEPTPAPYWSHCEVAERGQREPFRGTADEAVAELERRLRDAIRLRMIADVPLGAFLSGGIDSSTVVALMQAESTRPVRTFSIGFEEQAYNEADFAAAVARHLHTDHTELYVTADEARDVIPRLPTLYDEPFGDSSQIPTFLVSQLARRHVTVSLSGDGGDEFFCGYERYGYLGGLWRKVGWMPAAIRRPIAAMLRQVVPRQTAPGLVRKLRTLAEFLGVVDGREFYSRLNTHWRDPETVVIDGFVPDTLLTDYDRWAGRRSLYERMMFVDAVTYLPDDILVKVDRASMGVSLEARVPILDHRVVEFAWSLPPEMKFRNGQGKWILRQLLQRYVPRELFERPKTGFGLPIDTWLRGPLRDWAEALLDRKRLQQEGFFHADPIREKWEQHLAGRHEWHFLLWDVLMFQAWWEAVHVKKQFQ